MGNNKLCARTQKESIKKMLYATVIIREMIDAQAIINYASVAKHCNISRTTLYQHATLRRIIADSRVSNMSHKELQQEVIRLRLRVRELEKNLEKHDLPSCTSVDNLSSLTSMPGENTYIGDMSRNTAYRHGHLLQRYIEYCARQLSCTNPLFIIDGLKADIAEQHRQICLMADRDIDALRSRLAVTQRDRLLQEKAKLLEQKEKRIMELTRDCQQLRIALEQSNPSHRLLKLP